MLQQSLSQTCHLTYTVRKPTTLPGGASDVEEQAIFIFTAVAHHIMDPQTFVELVSHAFESESAGRSIFLP